MKKTVQTPLDIAVVSYGCVLPDAPNAETFWKNICESHCSIRPVSETHWYHANHYSPYRELEDKTYSKAGADVSEELIVALAAKHKLDRQEYSRMDIMAIEAATQAMQGLSLPKEVRTLVSLGVMNPDEGFFGSIVLANEEFWERDFYGALPEEQRSSVRKVVSHYLKKIFRDFNPDLLQYMPVAAAKKVRKHIGLKGSALCVDAACAASLASIDIGIKKLVNGEIDFALTGGLDTNMSSGAYVIFSRVGALAVDRCLPFDTRTDGLTQGEGAVVFGLVRHADAVKWNLPVHAVIRSCEASSDGRAASLFQPNLNGQLLVYEKAYAGLENRRVDYIEAHGTGTRVGDQTETKSLSLFFRDFKIPVGSVKACVGHTKATAGATSLLKCIFVMKDHFIPASDYIEETLFEKDSQLFVNKEPVHIPRRDSPLRTAISSLGFGGTNFHMVVEDGTAPVLETPVNSSPFSGMVLLANSHLALKDYDSQWFLSKDSPYRLPPKSLTCIDHTQLLAVQATHAALKSAGISLESLDKEKINVVSASTIGLDILHGMAMRISLDGLAADMELDSANTFSKEERLFAAQKITRAKEKFKPINEDYGPGMLNNVIAGRVCNALNLRGKSYNVDCDEASIALAMDVIRTELMLDDSCLWILVGVHETLRDKNIPSRDGVSCYVLCSKKFATQHMLPIQSVMEVQHA